MAATVGDETRSSEPVGDDSAPAAAPAPEHAPQVRAGELVSAASALGLLIVLLAMKWYGVAGVPDPSYARPAISTAENGWDGLTIGRWVIVATIIVALGTVFLHASQRAHGTKTDTSRVVTAFGGVTAVLLTYRVLIALPDGGRVIDQKLGAVLGLFCALGIAIGGLESIGEQRLRVALAAPRSRRRSRRKAEPRAVAAAAGGARTARHDQAPEPAESPVPPAGTD